MQKLTKGAVKNKELIDALQKKKELQIQEEKLKKFQKKSDEELFGTYKRIVTDEYISTYSEKYGNNFDYNTLINGLKFSQGKNGLSPNFTFDETSIKFRGDIKKLFKKFNENAISEFISNEDEINGANILNNVRFVSQNDLSSYINSKDEYKEIKEIKGNFFSTNCDNRYNYFNKLTKSGGYTTIEQASSIASNRAKKVWENIKDKVYNDIKKKFKI